MAAYCRGLNSGPKVSMLSAQEPVASDGKKTWPMSRVRIFRQGGYPDCPGGPEVVTGAV